VLSAILVLAESIAVGRSATTAQTASRPVTVGTTGNTPQYADIFIATNGSFFQSMDGNAQFDSSYHVLSGANAGSDRAQGAILLHEFSHLVKAPGFIQFDGGAGNPAQRRNNDLMVDKCGDALRSLAN
jgi:hypothetical protein